MSEAPVLTQRDGAVETVVLNRPEVLNATDAALAAALLAAVREAAADEGVRCLVLTGAGKGFCAGGDMRTAAQLVGSGADPRPFFGAITRDLHATVMALRRAAKPTLAAINGAAGGIGVSLAAACDLRVMAAGAKLKVAYTTVGLVPDGGWTATVTRLLGLGQATRLLFLDPVLDAQQARDLGLVHEVVPDERWADDVAALATRLAAGPTEAFAHTKELLNAALLDDLEAVLERERQAILERCVSAEFRERLAAFLAGQRRG